MQNFSRNSNLFPHRVPFFQKYCRQFSESNVSHPRTHRTVVQRENYFENSEFIDPGANRDCWWNLWCARDIRQGLTPEEGSSQFRSTWSNEDKRPPVRDERVHQRFQRSSRSLESKSTSECARKHSKINDMPDTRERVLVGWLVGEPGVENRQRKHQPQE